MAAPSAQARLTLEEAFERFASTVTEDDKRLFNDTTLKDVRDGAMQIERQLRARRMQRNMARLDPFLRGMEHYSKVVEVLCNGTPYLSWIWAPVKLMLMITVDSINAFEKLIEAYGKIADMMPRLDRLGAALPDDHNFQAVLALVYSDIIEFHRRAYKFVRRKSWAIFFSSMWAGFESRFNSILRSLAYHSELADKEAVAADISEAVRRSKDDDEKWKQQEREWQAAKVRTVLAWLDTNDTPPADILDRHLRDCLPKSCDWFVQQKGTQLWLGDSVKNSLLWLCGKPGAGKSTISSYLVQHAESNAIHVFYYFCSFLGNTLDGPTRLLRSFVSQVIQKHQDLAVYVHDIYYKSHPVATKRALLGLLPKLLQSLGSVRIVVDGIDEWSPRAQKDTLKDLTDMLSTDKISHICKVMIASRDTLDISRILRRKDKSAVTISLSDGDEGLAVNRSITHFVDTRLSDVPEHFDELDPDSSILASVKQTLLEKSHGMFLWVRLVLDSLDAIYSAEELRTIVHDLPSDLESLYERILGRLCSAPGANSHGGVSRIISLICFARRPLHKFELLHALSIPPPGQEFQVRSIPVASILDHCKPLIEERADSTMIPVHFSVKEFFLKSRAPQIVPTVQATLDISSVCAITLMRGLQLLQSDDSSSDAIAHVANGSYRLIPYAIEFWIEHCILYTSVGGTLDLDDSLPHSLARLDDAHRQCLTKLGTSTVKTGNTIEAGITHANEKLDVFSHFAVHKLMRDVLQLRQRAGLFAGEDHTDIQKFNIENDRTLFSKLASKYESCVVHLLAQHEVNGVAATTLRTFQASYASTAFRCRYPHCDRLSLGFASAELRLQHETLHMQRVYCQTVSCQYNRIGFAKRSALNAHTRKHHSLSAILHIPAKIRRAPDATEEESVNVLPQQAMQPQQAIVRRRLPPTLPDLYYGKGDEDPMNLEFLQDHGDDDWGLDFDNM
ncbi:hypothetical protein BKA63DRAFT_10537 [Paraphoma chrysanthemicola]|nr:hypothetical protein BKA63DRAFT_10537 [Paraphoma chrysanthemicola]